MLVGSGIHSECEGCKIPGPALEVPRDWTSTSVQNHTVWGRGAPRAPEPRLPRSASPGSNGPSQSRRLSSTALLSSLLYSAELSGAGGRPGRRSGASQTRFHAVAAPSASTAFGRLSGPLHQVQVPRALRCESLSALDRFPVRSCCFRPPGIRRPCRRMHPRPRR